jgi:DNA-binding MarR family transcriptional regulator
MQLLYASISAVTTQIGETHLTAWRSILNAHARVTEAAERALAEAGLPQLSWYDVLWSLQRAPGKTLRMGALAEDVVISRSGLTRLVDRLEAAGLLTRAAAQDDRRAVEVTITPEGSKLLRRMWPVYERVLRERIEQTLSPAEARAVSQALAKV